MKKTLLSIVQGHKKEGGNVLFFIATIVSQSVVFAASLGRWYSHWIRLCLTRRVRSLV